MKSRRHDLELVRRVLERDPEAMREFVKRCACIVRFLYAINRKRHGKLDRHSIEDLAQKVFLEMWSRIGTYRGEASLETWIWRFCYLQYLAWLQDPRAFRGQGDPEEVLSELPARDTDPGEAISASMDRVALARALLDLSPSKRELIQKKHFDGLTFEEIAAEEEIPVSTLKDRYYQALMDLQERASAWRDRVEKGAAESKKSGRSGPAKRPSRLPIPPEEGKGGRR